MPSDLVELLDKVRAFSIERDWQQFHSPKNLACALSVEAAELLEHFQWMPESASRTLSPELLSEVEAEMADVLIYLLQLSDQLEIDLVAAGFRKLQANEKKYPAEKAKGRSDKYNKL